MGGNALKERFLRLEAFHPVYERAYRQLYQAMFASGTAGSLLTGLTATARSAASSTATAVDLEAKNLLSTIESRTRGLATNAVVTAGG
jgi:spore coat protein CotH